MNEWNGLLAGNVLYEIGQGKNKEEICLLEVLPGQVNMRGLITTMMVSSN